MRKYVGSALVVLLIALTAFWFTQRKVPERRGASPPSVITVYSTTDTAMFAPILPDFYRANPGVKVRYVELDSTALYRRFLKEAREGRPQADILLSSAMDLQVKLVNDGYAAAHKSNNVNKLPVWARWRDEAFGFTFEPVVMAFNSKVMQGRPLPHTRRELLDAIKHDLPFWRNRIGSYDISASSVGYLLAAEDSRQSTEFSALLKAFGDAHLKAERNMAKLLHKLVIGELAVSYNVLGSYTRPLVQAGAPLIIVYPQDYTLAVMRTAVIPKNAPNPALAHKFLEYLLSKRGQTQLANRTGLSAIREDVGRTDHPEISAFQISLLRPIVLGPSLLVFRDRRNRMKLLENWENLVMQPAD